MVPAIEHFELSSCYILHLSFLFKECSFLDILGVILVNLFLVLSLCLYFICIFTCFPTFLCHKCKHPQNSIFPFFSPAPLLCCNIYSIFYIHHVCGDLFQIHFQANISPKLQKHIKGLLELSILVYGELSELNHSNSSLIINFHEVDTFFLFVFKRYCKFLTSPCVNLTFINFVQLLVSCRGKKRKISKFILDGAWWGSFTSSDS